MPVFHTKTIESILEPVAQQVNDHNLLKVKRVVKIVGSR